MSVSTSLTKKEPMRRMVNTRIFEHQSRYIKAEAKRSKGKLTESDVFRILLDEAITSRKTK